MIGISSRLLGAGTLAGLALVASTTAQAQVTTAQNITFGQLPSGNPTVTTYSEAGYTLKQTYGTITGTSGVGNPAPAIFTRDPAAFDLTSGGLFGITSIDVSTANFAGSTASYSVTGYLNNVLTFNDAFTTTTGGFSFATHSFNTNLLFDRVNVSFAGENGFAADIDNFRLFTVAAVTPPISGAVPEPASWVMLMLGVGAVGYTLRRRQSVRLSYAT